MATRKLVVEVIGDTSSVERALGNAGKETDKLNRRFGGLAATAGKAGVAGAILGLGYAVKSGIGEFIDAQKVTAQTNAVLKSTGGVANVSRQEIEKLSGSLMHKSGVDDEAIQSGANLLLTFTKVRNEVGKGNDIFNQATKATLDLSVAMGKDMNSSAILVGKALNDPIKGMGALARAGVQFDEAQKTAIKTMVATGDTAGAQKLILKELETQFGGSAEAAGKTFAGQVNIAKESALNFAGSMVEKAVPAIQDFIGGLTGDKGAHGALADVGAFIRDDFWPAVKGVLDLLKAGWDSVIQVFRDNEPEVRNILNGLKALFDGIKVVIETVVAPILKWVFTTALPFYIKTAITVLSTLTTAISGIAGFVEAVAVKFGEFFGWLKEKSLQAALDMVEPFSHLPGDLGGWARAAKNAINDELAKINAQKAIDKVNQQFKDWDASAAGEAGKKAGDAWRVKFLGSATPALSALTSGGATGDGVVGDWGMGAVAKLQPPVARNPGGLNPRILDELAIAQAMGLSLSSGYRPGAITSTGNPSLHGSGRAIDVVGSSTQMAAFARAVAGRPGLAEVLYSPVGGWYPGVGWTGLSGSVLRDHFSHVHVGTYDKGGWLMPGLTLAQNNTGRPERVLAGAVPVVNVYVAGSVTTERDLARTVRDEIVRAGLVNGGGMLGGQG